MTYDRFINSYVSAVKSEIEEIKNGLLLVKTIDQMKELQGRAEGLQQALHLLDAAIEDQQEK